MRNTVEVLMIEDNPADVVLLQEAVAEARLAYRMHVASDGVEATEFLEGRGKGAGKAPPDLIVLDLHLPRKSGSEVLDVIRSDPRLCDIPLVLLTGSESELEKARSRNLPEQSYRIKPRTFEAYVALAESIEAFRQGAEGSRGKRP
jgi:CheY-like chemotaxis protein